MNQNTTVKGAGGQDNAKFGVSPGDLPDRTLVTLQSSTEFVGRIRDIVDLDSAVYKGSR